MPIESEIDPAANIDISPSKLRKFEFPHIVTEHQNLTFPQAIVLVIDGSCITRTEWRDPSIYIYLKDEYLVIHKADGTQSSILLRDGDLLATDWRKVANLEGYIED